MCPIPPGSAPLSPKGALESSRHWCWVSPLTYGVDGTAGTALGGTMSLSLTGLRGSPTCRRASELLRVCGDELLIT